MKTLQDPRLIVGFDTSDDAAVYEVTPGLLLVHTVDFFTPVVDDPYVFGRIAAANSLSDVYAMGGTPLSALNVVGFPRSLGGEILEQILRGGADKAAEAGVAIAGGHTVDDPEPKYGLSVVGTVAREDLLTNATAREGDALVLTKPLGSGVLTTAIKRGELSPKDTDEVVAVMEQLNAEAAGLMKAFAAHACTDVTGFGFLGHLLEMAKGSGRGAEVLAGRVPVLPTALGLCAAGKLPGGSRANLAHLSSQVTCSGTVEPATFRALHDAQTSGGLLVALPPENVGGFLAALRPRHPWAAEVGRITAGPGILVRP